MHRDEEAGVRCMGMNVIAEVTETIATDTGEETTYECIDCLAEFDERRQLCPKCGGERSDIT